MKNIYFYQVAFKSLKPNDYEPLSKSDISKNTTDLNSCFDFCRNTPDCIQFVFVQLKFANCFLKKHFDVEKAVSSYGATARSIISTVSYI